MDTEHTLFDVVVIGAGPAGYTAAIRAAQLGKTVACVDSTTDENNKPKNGGTCLNWGCIPSKTLLDTSHKYLEAETDFGKTGISVTSVRVDIEKVMEHKNSVIRRLNMGIASLLKANKVRFVLGKGTIVDQNTVKVTAPNGAVSDLKTEHIVIATGSKPIELPSLRYNSPYIVDSTGALEFDAVPRRLAVIGSGVIGLELGSVWARFGSEVTIFEAMDSFLPAADKDISREALKILRKQGLNIKLGVKVKDAVVGEDAAKLVYEEGGKSATELFDKVIVAVGRSPYTEGLLEGALAEQLLDDRGFVVVDNACRTPIDNIFAIGDVVRGAMLAHKGAEEGVMVVSSIVNQSHLVNYDLIPSVIYTHPEIAWVGKTEAQLDEENVEYKSAKFPFMASGRAMASGESDGFVKIIADAETDRVLGVHILGPQASEIIAQAVIAMEFSATSEDLGMTMFAHPTLSEAVHEAAMGISGKAIHMPNRPPRKRR